MHVRRHPVSGITNSRGRLAGRLWGLGRCFVAPASLVHDLGGVTCGPSRGSIRLVFLNFVQSRSRRVFVRPGRGPPLAPRRFARPNRQHPAASGVQDPACCRRGPG
ncbi:hypothetical protein JOF29_000161 [Kribbella aluminosa]|uniref:Uncharacterized protein n=1 Tax=Kribbella aluminosa TaxID=416017 RepID=A0ABS4UBR6_9ACTN|nr:hypothetical protein [Kribbella aluminosa]